MIPIMLSLSGRHTLVVGCGEVGRRKIETLLNEGAYVHVVDPLLNEDWVHRFSKDQLTYNKRAFVDEDLEGIFVLVAATSDYLINDRLIQLAKSKGILCTRVDGSHGNCGDFSMMASFSRGDLTIGIATGGRFAGLSKRLKMELETHFPQDYNDYLQFLARQRDLIVKSDQDVNGLDKKKSLDALLAITYEDFKRGPL